MPITVDERAKLGGTILDMVDIIRGLAKTNITPAQETALRNKLMALKLD